MLALGLGVTSSLTSVEALARGGFSANGVLPRLALDFDNNSYVLDTGSVSFDAAFTAGSPKLTYSTTSNSTMVNSSGNIVWAPHNLVTYSEDFSNAAWLKTDATISGTLTSSPDGQTNGRTVTFAGTNDLLRFIGPSCSVGESYTISIWAKAGTSSSVKFSILFSGSGLGQVHENITLTSEWQRFTISGTVPSGTPDTVRMRFTSLEAGSFQIFGAQLNRSDLGGMGQVPGAATGFEYYVPTSGSAKYLPRVGHHVYNGSSFVNEGLLIESEARTNLVTYSEDFTNASWSKSRGSAVLDAVGPDGVTNSAATFTDNGATGTNTVYIGEDFTVSTSTAYTFSIFAKADQLSHIHIRAVNFTTPAEGGVYFDLSAGTVGTANAGLTGKIEDFGNGWHRCSASFTTDVADTTGSIRVFLADGESLFVDLDGTSSVLLYGAQFEEAPTVSSYIPTTGATVTRAAQSLAVPAHWYDTVNPTPTGSEEVTNGTFDTDLSDWVNSSTGSSTFVFNNGTAELFKSVGDTAAVYQSLSLVEGAVYQLTWEDSGTGGNVRVGTTVNAQNTVAITTDKNVVFVAGSSNFLQFNCGTNNATAILDNISVRKVSTSQFGWNNSAVSIQMEGRITFADEDEFNAHQFVRWREDNNNFIALQLGTNTGDGGRYLVQQRDGGTLDSIASGIVFTTGVLTPFNIASRHGSTFINGAVSGTALTADTTPTALTDLSGTNLQIAFNFMGTVRQFVQYDADIGDTGLEEATS